MDNNMKNNDLAIRKPGTAAEGASRNVRKNSVFKTISHRRDRFNKATSQGAYGSIIQSNVNSSVV